MSTSASPEFSFRSFSKRRSFRIAGEVDAEEFGDAVEDVEELEMIYGKRKCLTLLETGIRLSSIYQRRAILRNKVQACQNILNKGGLRDSSVSFTGRLSGDSSVRGKIRIFLSSFLSSDFVGFSD